MAAMKPSDTSSTMKYEPGAAPVPPSMNVILARSVPCAIPSTGTSAKVHTAVFALRNRLRLPAAVGPPLASVNSTFALKASTPTVLFNCSL
jgi:hypothetical protein